MERIIKNLKLDKEYVISDEFKLIIYNNKISLFGSELYKEELLKLNNYSTDWFFDPACLEMINKIIAKNNEKITDFHIYFLPKNINFEEIPGEYHFLNEEEILELKDNPLSDEAFLYDEDCKDKLGISYSENGEILGLAGASENYPDMYELGVNVKANNKGIASSLIYKLTNELINKGILPYYGTGISHFASQNVCIKVGYRPSFIVITGKKIEE